MTSPKKTTAPRDTETYYDIECDCGCGQKLRLVYHAIEGGLILDIGIMEHLEKRPKCGIILHSKTNLPTFLKALEPALTKDTNDTEK